MPISPSGVETVPYLFNQQNVGSANFSAQLNADLNDLATAITQVNQGTAPGTNQRLRLTAPTSFYFDTGAGSDTNPGTSASPWQSPAPLGSRYDFGNQTVTLNLKNNTAVNISIPAWTGAGALILDLGGHTVNPTTGGCISTPLGVPLLGSLTIQNGTLSNAGGDALDIFNIGRTIIGASMTFGACGSVHINAAFGQVIITSNYSVSGAASRHWRGQIGGTIGTGVATPTISNTSGGALNFPIFCFADGGAQVQTFALFPMSGANNWAAATGQRYLAQGNAVINTNGAGPNYFPGNLAGSTDTGGQYK